MQTNPQRLAGLTAEEQELHRRASRATPGIFIAVVEALESLSRSRALLEKHQWSGWNTTFAKWICPECRFFKPAHATSCAIAAELAGTVEDP